MAHDAPTPGITRRSLVKGAAWSVPVVAVAVGTASAAASTTKGDLGILYWDPRNTWGQFIHSGGVIIVNGSSADATVTSIIVTLDYGSGFTISDYTDNTGSSGWVLTQPFTNGVVQFSYAGVPLIPYAKPEGIYMEFSVASGAIPTSLSITAVSAQANSTAGVYAITAG